MIHMNGPCFDNWSVYKPGKKRLESSTAKRDQVILVHGKMEISQQCPASQESQPSPGGYIRQSIASRSRMGIVLLSSALGQPHLEYCVQFWAPEYRKNIQLLESVQRRAMKMVKGLEGKLYEKQLRALGLFSLKETEGRPHWTYNFLMRGRGAAGNDLFIPMTSDWIQGNGMKLSQGRGRLGINEKIFHPEGG
ncbi:hypothetical protein WISP_111441 [Willisornis vidua]|uniref:Uncharacterized protein n=1 Tax=Willisornis vidua TaxID=1566151 RepID=A0ABQ9CVI2_9PASS|nr:hypothetical protein WISP_111441 [Willisornis vidua]